MRKLLYTILQTGLFAVISCMGISLQAQDTFIQSVPVDQIPDSPEMAAYRERLRKNPDITGYHFIKLNALATSQKDGVLLLNIPDGPAITAVASHVEYESANEYEWIGKTDEDRGTVIVVSKAGRVCAHISTPAGVYEIFPAPAGLYCLQIIDPEKAGDVGCATSSSAAKPENGRTAAAEPAIKQEGNVNAKMQPCQALTYPRVLVLYTPKALTLAGNITTLTDHVNLSISQFNSCIYNSGITSAAALVLAGIAPLNFIEHPNAMDSDKNDLIKDVTAKNLRNQYQADVVVLLTDGTYGGGDVRGVSGTVILENERAYSIVELWCATSRKTFAHEVGHLYGCRHDDDNTELPGLIATPNPANDQISVSYNLQSDTQVRLDVLDQSGRIIEILKDDKALNRKGRYSVKMKSKNLSIGTYFIRLIAGQRIETCRIIITK